MCVFFTQESVSPLSLSLSLSRTKAWVAPHSLASERRSQHRDAAARRAMADVKTSRFEPDRAPSRDVSACVFEIASVSRVVLVPPFDTHNSRGAEPIGARDARLQYDAFRRYCEACRSWIEPSHAEAWDVLRTRLGLSRGFAVFLFRNKTKKKVLSRIGADFFFIQAPFEGGTTRLLYHTAAR